MTDKILDIKFRVKDIPDDIPDHIKRMIDLAYEKEMNRRTNNPDMIQTMPDTIDAYAKECKGKHRIAVVFCPDTNYMYNIKNAVFRKGGYKSTRNELIHKSTHLLFEIPNFPSLIALRPDNYFIFEQMTFPKQNKEMWEIIRRWM